LDGEFVDATPFQSSDGKAGDPINYFGDKLEAAGYHRLGGETMISGVTGEEFPVDIFIGTVYYQVRRMSPSLNDATIILLQYNQYCTLQYESRKRHSLLIISPF
jgi:DNA-directed RNA polymerase I subunit RPA2